MNKLWTILDGLPEMPTFGDWRRLTETSGLHVSAKSRNMINSILGDTDVHLRGFMVESVLQAALKSSYAAVLKEFDPVNTYHIDISVFRENKATYTGSDILIPRAVFYTNTNRPLFYETSGTAVKNENIVKVTFAQCINGKPVETTTEVITDLTKNSSIDIGNNNSVFIPELESLDSFSFKTYSIQTVPPLKLFIDRINKMYPSFSANTDVINTAGKFVYSLID